MWKCIGILRVKSVVIVLGIEVQLQSAQKDFPTTLSKYIRLLTEV